MEDHRKVMEELVRGRELANQLQQVIHGDDKSAATTTTTPFAQNLVNNVIRSFTNTLFLLDEYPTYESYEEMQQIDSSLVRSEDSQESYKSFTVKNRRGCYKRRKTIQTWEVVSEIPTNDDHQWRKYGQKTILDAKYSRNYYRCTHKFDQRCQATKQVQQIQDEPPLYKTTYYGHHTCKSLLNHEMVPDLNSPSHTSTWLSFNNTFPMPTKQDCPFLSSYYPSPSMTKECKEEVLSSSTLDNSSRHITPSTLESDHRDIISSVLDDSVELDDVFQSLLGFNDQLGMFWSLN